MIAIGSDHGGMSLKVAVIECLKSKGIKYKDFGAFTTESVDYPDYGQAVAEAVVSGECQSGIVICGTGLGISIAANKVKGIRAAVCTDPFMAKMARQHNNANILALGERVVGVGLAMEILEAWLNSDFESEGRHGSRVDKIKEIEKKYFK